MKRITFESVRELRKRINEAVTGKVYAGINHDTANEDVVISYEEVRMEYTDSCEKDPNNTYVVECDDESVYIYPYSAVEAGIRQAIKEVKNGAVEIIDCVPGAYLSEDNEEDWELFLADPDAWYKRVVEESFTDCDSSSGMCIFSIEENGDINVIANGDLNVYFTASSDLGEDASPLDIIKDLADRNRYEAGWYKDGSAIYVEYYFVENFRDKIEEFDVTMEDDDGYVRISM